jgi:hypothetical protein
MVRSELCNILFTRELARRLHGTGVTANCLARPRSQSQRQLEPCIICDEEDCLAVSDSRSPIDKRYNDRDVFSDLVSAAIDRLIHEGWILEGDRVLYLENCLATYQSVVGKQ